MFHSKSTVTGFCLLSVALLLTAGLQNAEASAIKSTAARPSKGTDARTDLQQVSALPAWSDQSKGTASVVSYGDGNIIYVNGYSIDTRQGEPSLPNELKYTAPKGDESAYYIVQFRGPIREEWRKGLENEGAEVMFYLPNYAFVVRMTEPIRARLAASKGEISWTGLYHPAYKISERAAARTKGAALRAQVLLFNPEKTAENVKQIEAIVGHKIWYQQETEWAPGQWNHKIFVDIAEKDLAALAQLKGVYWIEPMARMTINNQRSQYCVQKGVADSVRTVWRKGITGQGQIIQDLDTGCRETQYMFRGSTTYGTWYWDANHRKVVAQQPGAYATETALGWTHGWMSRFGDESANSYHGTHTSGSIVGKDTMGTISAYNGMAKDARLLFIDGGGDSGSVYGTSDLNIVGSWGYDSLYNHLGLRAYISSNSWGDSSANGIYDASCMEVDQFMWSHKDFLFLFSDGNDGSYSNPGYLAGSPASNKNGIAVGALEAAGAASGGANTKASYSSWGKHVDGRMNPTLTAPGGDLTNITSANGGADNTTLLMAGTSMACPIAAGACALLRQYLVDGWYPTGTKVAADGFTPSAALLKAMMCISGDSTSSSHATCQLDSVFGWGRVNLDTAIYFSGDNTKLLLDDNRTGLVTGETYDYIVNIPASATNLKVMMAYTDYPGALLAGRELVNDLDLDVYDPTGATRYRGNRFTSTAPRRSNSAATTSDSLNPFEGVHIQSPATGRWTARITGKNVAYGPQPFALVITYRTTTTATMGTVHLDKPVYGVPAAGGVGDTVKIEINDVNKVAASCTVRVYSKLAETSTKPETLVCSQTGTGLYTGKIALWMGNVVHGDSRLTVDQRDTIIVLYNDDNPAYTDTAKALVDATIFRLYNVRAADPVPPNATQKFIRWNTTESASQKVYYGTTTALGSVVTVDTPLMASHAVQLTGLQAATSYYFDVESRDFHGNTVRDNNAGRHYTFSTGSSSGADVLIIVLNNDLQGVEFYHPELLTQALNVGGWSYDWWSTKDQGDFSRATLQKYKAVYFQVGQENYPCWTVAQRETIKVYHDNGGRFAMTGHDIGWAMCDKNHSASPYETTADSTFCEQYLHFHYIADIGGAFATIKGMTGDPISGAYTGSVNYYPPRTGFAADSIRISTYAGQLPGKDSVVWKGPDTSTPQDSCGIRWESTNNLGTAGVGVWGGAHTKMVENNFEITQIDTTNKTNSSVRVDILNKMFIWLIGHNHPIDTIQTPVAGTTYTASPISIAWRSYAYGGASVDTTWVEYSSNGGSSWNVLTSGHTVTSPYSWDISALENGSQYQVRVRVKDTGVYPVMSGYDTVGNFIIKKASGGDLTGPMVLPGSISLKRNPVSNSDPLDTIIVSAIASDSATGLSNIATAKCSLRVGTTSYVYTMSGSYSAIQVPVVDTIRTQGWPAGTYKLFVMAADNSAKALRWGLPESTYVTVANNLAFLSVNMSMAQALTAEDGIVVTWQTASESNTYQWTVERGVSESGPFTQIATIAAAGNSSQPTDYRYKDSAVNPGIRYYYQIVEVDQDGKRTAFGPVSATASGIKRPTTFALAAPRPNPFGGKLEIRYQLPTACNVSLVIYNINGQRVRTLQNGVQQPSFYTATWDGKDDQGMMMSNGVYIYKLKANAMQGSASFESLKRATMIK